LSLNSIISPQNNTSPVVANILPAGEQLFTENKQPFPQPIQCKLNIGSPDDPLEHEADAMADKVMRMPEPSFVQRKCAECEEEDEQLQRKSVESPEISFIQAKLIQRAGLPPSPSLANAVIGEEEDKTIRRKAVPDIQRMEHVKGGLPFGGRPSGT